MEYGHTCIHKVACFWRSNTPVTSDWPPFFYSFCGFSQIVETPYAQDFSALTTEKSVDIAAFFKFAMFRQLPKNDPQVPNLYFDLKSLGGDTVPVRARSPAPNSKNPNRIFQAGVGFGFLLFFSYDFFPNGAPVRKESKPRGPRKKKKYDDSS